MIPVVFLLIGLTNTAAVIIPDETGRSQQSPIIQAFIFTHYNHYNILYIHFSKFEQIKVCLLLAGMMMMTNIKQNNIIFLFLFLLD